MTFLSKELQFLEGQEEFFHGNSRITSDCRVGSILKTLSGCLYASRELFGVHLLVMVIRVNCAAISAVLRSSTLVKSYNSYEDSEEGIISFERTKTNHDKLPRENNSVITTRQIAKRASDIMTQTRLRQTNWNGGWFWGFLKGQKRVFLKHLWNKNFAYIPCISLRTKLSSCVFWK